MPLRNLSGLAPGDFKTVRDRFAFRNKKDITHEILVSALGGRIQVKDVSLRTKEYRFLTGVFTQNVTDKELKIRKFSSVLISKLNFNEHRMKSIQRRTCRRSQSRLDRGKNS